MVRDDLNALEKSKFVKATVKVTTIITVACLEVFYLNGGSNNDLAHVFCFSCRKVSEKSIYQKSFPIVLADPCEIVVVNSVFDYLYIIPENNRFFSLLNLRKAKCFVVSLSLSPMGA